VLDTLPNWACYTIADKEKYTNLHCGSTPTKTSRSLIASTLLASIVERFNSNSSVGYLGVARELDFHVASGLKDQALRARIKRPLSEVHDEFLPQKPVLLL
jgi:hypothetical protein